MDEGRHSTAMRENTWKDEKKKKSHFYLTTSCMFSFYVAFFCFKDNLPPLTHKQKSHLWSTVESRAPERAAVQT